MKDILKRALHTFWQTGLAFVILSADPVIKAIADGNWHGLVPVLVAIILGAIAAGLSAVKSLLVKKLGR